MLIETTQLPTEIQEKILQLIEKGEIQAVKPQKLIGGEKVFGSWKRFNLDGLEYERALREE